MSEMATFFESYSERYMDSDVGAISALYEAPLLAVREGRAIHPPNRTAVREHLTELMDAYAKAGAARADVAELDVESPGKSSVFATVRWHVRDASGALLQDFKGTYHLLRTGRGGAFCPTQFRTTRFATTSGTPTCSV